jgi:Cu/Ag efflux protein CusF
MGHRSPDELTKPTALVEGFPNMADDEPNVAPGATGRHKEILMNTRRLLVFSAPLLMCSALFANTASTAAVAAEVRKVDAAQNKITLRHDPIPHLDMSAMTMVFEVREAADRKLLPQIKPGQRLRFVAAHQDGAFVARNLELIP